MDKEISEDYVWSLKADSCTEVDWSKVPEDIVFIEVFEKFDNVIYRKCSNGYEFKTSPSQDWLYSNLTLPSYPKKTDRWKSFHRPISVNYFLAGLIGFVPIILLVILIVGLFI